jgi:hypothetical protein
MILEPSEDPITSVIFRFDPRFCRTHPYLSCWLQSANLMCDITQALRHRFQTNMRLALTVTVVVVYLLHQDLWFWRTAMPLVFGFLPVGLFYHACYSLLACLLMILLVQRAWPSHLEEADSSSTPREDAVR